MVILVIGEPASKNMFTLDYSIEICSYANDSMNLHIDGMLMNYSKNPLLGRNTVLLIGPKDDRVFGGGNRSTRF